MPRQTKVTEAQKEDFKGHFPMQLRKLMEDNKTSQEVLGNAIGVKRQTISLYQQGQSSPSWKGLSAIAGYFGVTVDFLCGRSNFRKEENEHIYASDLGLSEKAIEVLKYLYERYQGAAVNGGRSDNHIMAVINLLIEHEGADYRGINDYGFPVYDNNGLLQIVTAIKDFIWYSLKAGEDYMITSDGSLELIMNMGTTVTNGVGPDGKEVNDMAMFDEHGRLVDKAYGSLAVFNSQEVITEILEKRILERVKQLKAMTETNGEGG